MISLIQTAEGALNETHAILQRMRELAVQSANDTNNQVDRTELQKEFNQLIDEIDRISNNTEFNTKTLLDGSFTGKFHIGANEGQSIELTITNMGAGNLGQASKVVYTSATGLDLSDGQDFSGGDNSKTLTVTDADGKSHTVTLDQNYADKDAVVTAINTQLAGTGIVAKLNGDNVDLTSDTSFKVGSTDASQGTDTTGIKLSTLKVDTDSATSGGILTQSDADSAITAVNNAIEKVSAERAKLGAYQNRLEHTINNLSTSSENLTAAESRIRDVDYALAA
ncbi:flagellin [Pallidibacillus thermolactis subsp. kokeshiiformis]|nr:flagellin [Pallidibacillus thermolactis]MED1673356.1 flagellin [Pallidibacillus thermolactis subsp. kokeshiiformis]